uniref:pyruvate carboxylase n=1 Tax=Rhodoblastus sp. TaxID=1962975 RepID=UPI0035AFAD34
EGGRIGRFEETGIPAQRDIKLNGHALQCRITAENPENNFIPDYGRISAYRGAMGFGIRIDGGTAYSGAIVTRFYDPLLEKVTAWAPAPREAIQRMDRALQEYRIRGVATNLAFLHNVVSHPRFQASDYTTRFIDETPALFDFRKRHDRATRLLTWLADVTINGHPETRDRAKPAATARPPKAPHFDEPIVEGSRHLLERLGPREFASWMRAQRRLLVTDTTMRDAHQSLLATRLRSRDIIGAADAYARGMPNLLSLECWGGATFDVAMRFLNEDPWDRLRAIRAKAPNLLTQMLLRGSNGVGYANYPDNVVRLFIAQAATSGVDIFRIFDCFNWVENMRVAIDAVVESNKLAEGAICYTGDILDPDRAKHSLNYYVRSAKELEKAGCHILAIKDMAGLLRPAAAKKLVAVLREETDLPLHFHTHDTSGIGGASIMAAVEAGVDAVDLAMDSMSGLTSQPCLGAIVEALRRTERDTGIDTEGIRRISLYWENVRAQYAAFECDNKAGASEVYLHEMPGGQFTNLKEQARALGLDGRWHDVARNYRAVNDLFGDIIKVTPSSKVVGDMALMMTAQNLSPEQVIDPAREIAFPESLVEMMRGDLGRPHGGWPVALQAKVLKGELPIDVRPGALLSPADLDALRAEAQKKVNRHITEEEFASYLMYPKVFVDYALTLRRYGPVSTLPTQNYFYGMSLGEEINVEIEEGKVLVIRLQAIGEIEEDGQVKVFFELNGQQRIVRIPNRAASASRPARRKADETNQTHVSAPMPGSVAMLAVGIGDAVAAGDVLLTLEAMKMETALHAHRAGKVTEVLTAPGQHVEARDLLFVIEEAA